MRLVRLIDRILAVMDEDERFVFTLDGQLATVDDYLELRPEAEGRIRRLVEAGRLAVGPWQVLMDEFLVSGETIVRNLEGGVERAEALGGAMPVGYLPDMFGHIAQMPQLLRRGGIGDAVVWRGVPHAVDRHAFRWESPDGSWVRAEYLVHGYWGAAYVLDIPERLAEKIELLRESLRPFYGDEPLLAMYGTDHSEPVPHLPELVEELNGAGNGTGVRLMTLAQHIAGASLPADAPCWSGELRSGARANMLMGVTSARIDLKAACARAERALERYAEPLLALWGAEWPERMLALAWKRVIENSAHDSICGCSADAVGAQVLVRYDEAAQIAGELTARALGEIAAGVARRDFAVVNPSPFARAGVVELEAPVPEDWPAVALELPDGRRVPAQELHRSSALLWRYRVRGREIPARMFPRIRGRALFERVLNGVELDTHERRITFRVGDHEDPLWLDVDEIKRELERAAAGAPDADWELEVVAAATRVLAAAVPAPALGWTTVHLVRGEADAAAAVRVEYGILTNGLVSVEAEPAGTVAIRAEDVTLTGVGRLVDGGDAGDTYNYAPPRDDVLVDSPGSVSVTLGARGHARAELVVTRTYAWPRALSPGEPRRGEADAVVDVHTAVELRAGEPFVRFRVSVDNPCSDHRLRFHVPLPMAVDRSYAAGQFCVVERDLDAEGGYGEVPLPTFPASEWVSAGPVAVLLDHPLEYELAGGRELALTVLRAVGFVSRNVHAYRDDPAGPEVAVPDAQCRRPWSVEFAVLPHAGSWLDADVAGHAERYRHPLLCAPGTGLPRTGPGSDTVLQLAGRDVALTALRRRGDRLELRLVCNAPEPRVATVAGGFAAAWEADLLGRAGAPLALADGALTLELGAWEIRTLQLARAPA
jgi:mannosylglycerate hydrolase